MDDLIFPANLDGHILLTIKTDIFHNKKSDPIKTELEAEIFQPNISITWKVEFQL